MGAATLEGESKDLKCRISCSICVWTHQLRPHYLCAYIVLATEDTVLTLEVTL